MFHEWQVVDMLKVQGFEFTNVVFMDALLDREWSAKVNTDSNAWRLIWENFATEKGLKLFVYDNYKGLHSDAWHFGPSLVIYINGHFRSSALSQPGSVQEAGREASKYSGCGARTMH